MHRKSHKVLPWLLLVAIIVLIGCAEMNLASRRRKKRHETLVSPTVGAAFIDLATGGRPGLYGYYPGPWNQYGPYQFTGYREGHFMAKEIPSFSDVVAMWPKEALSSECPMVSSGNVKLDDYEWLTSNIDTVIKVLEDGVMPPGDPWPQEKVDVVKQWRDAGMPK